MFKALFSELKLNDQEFLFQFQSHPSYPTALAFSDTLNFMGATNQVYRLEKEYWEELPLQFITLYKDQFTLVKRQGNQAVLFGDKIEKKSYADLAENSNEIVLVYAQPTEANSAQKNSIQYFFYMTAILVFCLSLFEYAQKSWEFVGYTLLSLVGAYLFVEIFADKFGQSAPAIRHLCGSGATLKTGKVSGCDQVIKADQKTFLGLKFADFGLVYFLGILLYSLLLSDGLLLKIFSTLALTAVGYSVYYQIRHKAFCKVCASAAVILLAQTFLAWILPSNAFSVSSLLSAGLLFSLSLGAVVLLNRLTTEREQYRKENLINLKFKRNYALFKQTLLKQDPIEFQEEGLLVGNEDAPLRLSIVSNPYCGFCKDAHHLLAKLFQSHPGKISLSFRFNYLPQKADDTLTRLMDSFTEIKNPKELLKAVDFWYQTRDIEKYKTIYPSGGENVSLQPIINAAKENQQHQFNFTPIFFINGYRFPDLYAREDLSYFIEDLLEDEEILKQKAIAEKPTMTLKL